MIFTVLSSIFIAVILVILTFLACSILMPHQRPFKYRNRKGNVKGGKGRSRKLKQ